MIRNLLLANGLLEAGAGLLFLFFPQLLVLIPGLEYIGTAPETQMALGMYGAVALVIGIYSILLLRHLHRGSLIIGSLFLFALFHSAIGLQQLIFNEDLRPVILHLIFAGLFWFSYWNQR